MRYLKNRLYIFLFLLFAVIRLQATHIVGGELYNECIGLNQYKVTLKLYTDCINGSPLAITNDSIAHFGIYDAAGNLIADRIKKRLSYTILPIVSPPCTTVPGNICVAEAFYIDTITLPPIPGGYYIAYQRCCRNNSILNLVNAPNTGATYFTRIPDASTVICNKSAHFKQYPPIFLCANVPFKYDHSAVDDDGDSLVYQICSPYEGLTLINAGPTTPTPPPYIPVVFLPPYSGSNPISASPALSINPTTGMMTMTPNVIGQWVVGVCVSEYRNGQLINSGFRDFQFNVVSCPGIVVSSVPDQTTFCDGNTVNFSNQSVNATTYNWDFGVNTLTNDTSNLFTPIFTYADTGTYVVTLIVNKGQACSDTATTTFRIYPKILPKYLPVDTQCVTTNNYNFSGSGVTTTSAKYNWDFGPNATPATSTSQNPTGIVFNTAGKQAVTLTISEFGCSQSYTDTVLITPVPTPSFTTPAAQCITGNSFNFSGSGNSGANATYGWNFNGGNPISATTKNVTGITYTIPGKYPVVFTINENGCSANISDSVIIYPLPQASFDPATFQGCKPLSVTFSDQSLAGTAINYMWKFGDGDSSSLRNPTHIYKNGGTYDVSLRIITTNGCIDTLTFTKTSMVTVFPGPQPGIDVNQTSASISDPTFIFDDITTNAISCKLFFGDGDSSLTCNGDHSYTKPGTYTVTQAVVDANGCVDTLRINVEVTPDTRFWIPDAFTPNDDNKNEFFKPIMDGIVTYDFMIFNRWGELIFKTTDQNKGWDGKYQSELCQQGVYVYKIRTTNILNKDKTYIGHVTLVR